MRFTWENHSERRILVSNFSVKCTSFREFRTVDWLRHVCASCLERHNPIVVYSMIGVQQVLVSTHDKSHGWHRVTPVCRDFRHGSKQVPVCFRADHSSSSTGLLHFCHHSFLTLLGCSSTWRCAYEYFSRIFNHSWSFRTSILEGANELVQVPLK